MDDSLVTTDRDLPSVSSLVDDARFQRLVSASEMKYGDTVDPDDTALYLPACAAGLKPGLIGSFNEIGADEVSTMLAELGFSNSVQTLDSMDAVVARASPSTELLAAIEPQGEGPALGRFLGVPEEDLCWYDDKEEIEAVTPVPEHLGLEEENWPGLRFARLVSWICRPTKAGLRRTIAVGEEWYELAVRLAEDEEYEDALAYAEKQFDRHDHPWYRFGE